MSSQPKSRRRRLLYALVVLLAVVAAGATYGFLRYPGMTVRMLEYGTSYTVEEQRNLFGTLRYWVGAMEDLRLNEETGIYAFPAPAAVGATGIEACRLHFHRGEFAESSACFETVIEDSGPSEERLFWLAMATMRQAEAENCLDHLLERGQQTQAGMRPAGEEAPRENVAPASHSGGTPPSGIMTAADNSHHGIRQSEPQTAAHLPFGPHSHQAYCVLPVAVEHRRGDLARRAAALFQQLLDEYDSDDRLYQWLLNFNTMTVGGFPEAVPERYRIDSPFIDAFYGEEARRKRQRYQHLRFVDQAAELGIDTHDTGRGVVVEDFDRDGYLDIVTGGAFHTLRYYRNLGGESFRELTSEVGLGDVTQPFVLSGADYDGDGWIDLFVARPFDRYMLFRNTGGSFVEVTEEMGLLAVKGKEEVAASWVSTWGDIDLDGDLDLFLAQWAMEMPFVQGLLGRPRMDSKLFLNEGGRFKDVTKDWGLAKIVHDEYYVGTAFGDYDGDGDPDLFASSPAGRATRLFENRGDHFAPVDLIDRREHGFFTAFVDVDHDGRLDIFQGGFSDARTSTAMTVFGENLDRFKSGHTTILRQTEEGRFEERNDFFGGDMPMATMGVSYGDLDLDGCHDFYVGTGNPESWFMLPNLMFVGERDGRRCTGRMDNVSMLEGFGTVQKGHSPVFFDFDEDGDQDVYSSLGGMWPTDAWPNQMFVNESDLGGAAWVKIRLRGRETNYYGVGARLTIEAEAPDGSTILRRYSMDNKTGFGSAPYLAHVGLLDATAIRAVEVAWPVSRCRHRYTAELNQLNVLDEAECRPQPSPQEGVTDA